MKDQFRVIFYDANGDCSDAEDEFPDYAAARKRAEERTVEGGRATIELISLIETISWTRKFKTKRAA